MVTAIEANVVTAAAAGDPAALERLVSDYLPLAYNIAGRALPAAADVDDAVRETMLCVVRGLPTLRDSGAFRSWLIAVAVNQVRNYARDSGARPRPLDVADPGPGFADLTLTELGLTGQRREVAMATAWLDADDRELLSLWWLAEAGHLRRGEVVTATGLDPHDVTMRIARMKTQLEFSRAVVRALCTAPICPELAGLATHWPRRPEPLWRKRFAHHVHECPSCAALAIDFVPAERLLVGLPLLPVPLAVTDTVFRQIAGALQAGVLHPMAASFQPTQVYEQLAPSYEQPGPSYGRPPTVPIARTPSSDLPPAPHSHRRIPKAGTARTSASHLAAKAAVALAATAAVVGAAVVASNLDNATPDPQAGGAPDAVSSSSPGTSADPLATATSSTVATSAASSSASAPATSRRSSPKPAPFPSQSPKSPASSGGNSAAATTAGNPPAPSSTTAPTTAPSSSSPSSSPGAVSPEDQVLALVNQARADQGLPPLTRTAGLDKSAATHTSVMASGCGLSHQCPGEPSLGARETAAGVSWTSAGENIGDGGPVANTNDAIASMALGLTKSMLAEQPPNDGHRRNILSSGFHHIGISVYRDSNGTVWLTQDFSD